MKVINFGSLNIDHVYNVQYFVRPGETITCQSYQRFAGGKGLNQSMALAFAGAEVIHFGKIGTDGIMLKDKLNSSGVNTDYIKVTGIPTGHALIEVDKAGENRIILYGGANQEILPEDMETVLELIKPGDYILCQNEISNIPYIIENGKKKNARVIFNPAPITPEVETYPLHLVDLFIFNETEGEGLTGNQEPNQILDRMNQLYPQSSSVLTLGEKGAIYSDSSTRTSVKASRVEVVDTTAAGDTFIGYFISELLKKSPAAKCLSLGCKAAGLCVSGKGASDSIPRAEELNS